MTSYAVHAANLPQLEEDTDYLVKLISARASLTKNEKDIFFLRFKVVSGEGEGLLIETELVFSPESPSAIQFFFQRMATLGADKDFFATDPKPGEICGKIMTDRTYRVRIRLREFNGRVKTDIVRINPLP